MQNEKMRCKMEQQKKTYISATVEVLKPESCDILTTSGESFNGEDHLFGDMEDENS